MTTSGKHCEQTIENGIHISYSFEYDDATARAAATGLALTDVGKFARQLDNNTIWMLTSITPTWISVSTGSISDSNKVRVPALKATAGSITKEQAVRIVGYSPGDSAITCELAQADSSATMPAFGIAEENFTNLVSGYVLIAGALTDVDTDTLTEGNTLYVSEAVAGALTETAPTTGVIQTVGAVVYADATNGVINVLIQDIHGDQLGGTLHSEATTTEAGFMSATDKVLLSASGIAAGQLLNSQAAGDPDWTENAAIRTIDLTTGLGAPSYVEGRLSYDNTNKTLRVYSDISDVALQVGQESWVRVVNKTGATITNGQLVYINGSFSEVPTIALAQADSAATVDNFIGMATHDIANDEAGFVTTIGVVNDINTVGYSNGDKLYVSETVAGAFTNVEPIAPNLSAYIGTVTSVGVLGKIFLQATRPRYSGNSNRFKVAPNPPYDYMTIKEAVDAAIAAGASASNWWVIEVFAGDYVEEPTSVPTGIIITNTNGERPGATNVIASNPNENLYSMSGGALIGLNFSGVTDSAKALIRIATVGEPSNVLSCSVKNCSTGIFIGGGASAVIRWLRASVALAGDEITDAAIHINGADSTAYITSCIMTVEPGVLGGFTDNPIETAIKATDQGNAEVFGCLFGIAPKNANQSCIFVNDNAGLLVQGCCFYNANAALRTGASGTNTIISTGNCLTDCTVNFEILSATGTIYAQGSIDELKTSIVAGGLLTGILEDRSERESVIIGSVTYQFPESGVGRRTDLGQFFHDNMSSGLTNGGGVVTDGGGLSVDVSAGTGWVVRASPVDLTTVTWEADNLVLTANTLNWVYYDGENEVLAVATSEPGESSIKLAQVATSGVGVRFIHKVYSEVDKTKLRLHEYLLSTRKFALNSGLALTQGTGITKIQVDSGSYYRALDLFSYAGSGGDATFSYFYGADGATEIAGQTSLNITQWDDAGVLTVMSDGYYRTDTAILTSDGRISLILGDEEFETAVDAELADRATVPTFMEESGCYLAQIVVLKGSGIDSIIDIRPDPNAATALSGGGGGGVTNHSLLSNLGSDDHVQYLLTAGSRAMTGNLNLGANNITNVGTVDGVDVSTHAARHVPGAADAVTTGVPVAVTVGTAATEGVGASFARNDHQHGVAAGSPLTIGTANSDGVAATVARADHVHAHGDQTVGTLHAVTSSTAAGFQPQSNLAAAVAPTVNDDSSAGYVIGSRWINITTQTEYVCVASTVGAAVWIITSSSTIATGSGTEVSATTDTSTTSVTYTQMADMTSTPAVGTYLVTFSASGNSSSGLAQATYAIHVAAAVVQRSERNLAWNGASHTNSFETALHSQAIVTVTGAQVVDVRYKTSTGTFTVHERNLVFLKLA